MQRFVHRREEGGSGGERDQTLLLNQRGAAACYQTSAHLKVVIFSPKTRQVVLYNLLSKNRPIMHDTRKDEIFPPRNKNIEDGGFTVDLRIIKVHTSN